MNFKNKIFVFDYNHTLVNTALAHGKAMKEMAKVMQKLGFKKQQIKDIIKGVHYSTSLMIAGFLITNDREWDYVPGGKEAYKELLQDIEYYQRGVLQKWGFIKKWSREVFLQKAAKDIGVKLTNNIIRQIVDAYWEAISCVKPFVEAKILFRELRKQGISVFILTSSDGRLKLVNRQFIYDPVFSEKTKRKRLQRLREDGLRFKDLIIGDPEDKPTKAFFEKGVAHIRKSLKVKVNFNDLVMIGNSYQDDLDVPLRELSFGAGILVEEHKKPKKIDHNLFIVGNLREVVDLLK